MSNIELWQASAERQLECAEFLERYDLYHAKLFSDYEPLAKAVQQIPRDFYTRLENWLENYNTDIDRWNAFKLVDDIFFIGKHELTELYRIAFDHVATEWLINLKKLDYFDTSYSEKFETAVNETWFCPITDSLRINSFKHINHIDTPEYFPDWRSLEKFGDYKKINAYIKEREIKQLVLIEDIVGSGKQITPAIKFASDILNIPILVLPLVIGESGNKAINKIQSAATNITYEPVVILNKSTYVTKKALPADTEKNKTHRSLVKEYQKITKDSEPFGYEVEQGYLLVTHANCPNGTIKPIHADKKWSPLFPRSKRRTKV